MITLDASTIHPMGDRLMAEHEPVISSMRLLLKEMSRCGLSYGAVVDQTETKHHWTASAIRQFARRDTKARFTPKLLGLAQAMNALIQDDAALSSLLSQPDILRLRKIVDRSEPIGNEDGLIDELDRKAAEFRERAQNEILPEALALARFGRDQKTIFILYIEIVRSSSAWVFSMKISGGGGQKRLVLGEIRKTAMHFEFLGTAYLIDEPMSEMEFYNSRPFEIDFIEDFTAPQEIGQEKLTITATDIAYPILPVAFSGLDGAGRPIAGIGTLISQKLFHKLKIPRHVVGWTSEPGDSPDLEKIMSWCNCSTVLPTEHDALELRKRLFTEILSD